MKRYHLFSILILVLLQSCSEPVALKVGLSLPTQREERWVRDKEIMQSEADKQAIELVVTVSDNNASAQIRQCEQLLAQGIEVLILAPHDAKSAATIVEMAHRQKVPVISYDRLIINGNSDLYISFDNEAVGQIQARFLLDKAPKGKYIVLAGSPTDNNATMFKAGAMKLLQPEFDNNQIELVLDASVMDWKPIEAYSLVKGALAKLEKLGELQQLTAILAPNDNTARAVIKALDEYSLAGKVFVTGQDAEIESAKMIAQGLQSMTVFKDTRLLGKKAIEYSLKLLDPTFSTKEFERISDGKFNVNAILLKPILVTPKDLDHILIDTGYIRRQDVYGVH